MATIRERVVRNIEIPSDDTDVLTNLDELIGQVKDWIVGYCHLDRFPETAQGYSESGGSPSTDLTALSSNSIEVNINGQGPQAVSVDLSACTSGANTAAELQSKVQALGVYGADEVTVEYDSSGTLPVYRVTSGRYGATSSIIIGFYEGTHHLARAMKLSPVYGGEERPGALASDQLDSLCVQLVTIGFQRIGVEGMASASIRSGITFAASDIPDSIRLGLQSRRRYSRRT